MNTLFITYTLEDYDDTYKKISKQLKSYSNWAKLFQRAWIIQTTKSTRQVRDELAEVIENKGKIVIINITNSGWATYKISSEITKWMKENI